MDLEQLKNLQENDYIWLRPPGSMHIGYVAKVIEVKKSLFTQVTIYSKLEGYENAINLHNIGFQIVLLKELSEVKPNDLTKSCYIVIEYIHEEGLNRYQADVCTKLIKNDVLHLNGYEFQYDSSKHKLYKIPFSYY